MGLERHASYIIIIIRIVCSLGHWLTNIIKLNYLFISS